MIELDQKDQPRSKIPDSIRKTELNHKNQIRSQRPKSIKKKTTLDQKKVKLDQERIKLDQKDHPDWKGRTRPEIPNSIGKTKLNIEKPKLDQG